MDAYREAYVYIRNDFSGILKETDYGYSFKYDKEYLKNDKSTSISLTMPKTETEYRSNYLFPFFDGLIPEGWLLDVVVHNWKMDRNDRFGILLVACHDPIGNVTINEVKK